MKHIRPLYKKILFHYLVQKTTADGSIQTDERTISITMDDGFVIAIDCHNEEELDKISTLINAEGKS